ncbi:MAG TPA: hypothetical protein P5274_03045 [Candidatus Paceibacterota bacterium]|nr:hypothetical protein [Candidatus Paceibacterota bacterium]
MQFTTFVWAIAVLCLLFFVGKVVLRIYEWWVISASRGMPCCSIGTQEGITDSTLSVINLKRLKKSKDPSFRKLRWFRAADRELRVPYPGALYEVNDHCRRTFFSRDFYLVGFEDYSSQIWLLLTGITARGEITMEEIAILRGWNENVYEDPSCPESRRYSIRTFVEGEEISLEFDSHLQLVGG